MTSRSKILRIFGIVYIGIALSIFWGLKSRLKNNFSEKKLENIISSPSSFRDMTTDVCRYEILGEPKEIENYIKMEMVCNSGKKANSTISLSAITNKTVDGILEEYARVVGFDKKILDNDFSCFLDGKPVSGEMKNQEVKPIVT
ncbi:MAG: hypothetical protein PHX34_04660, partial [Candidatus Shapirobacteria bacterium]|nr:hypothetical protein [Candidatus Shapirobacteria bacterium]